MYKLYDILSESRKLNVDDVVNYINQFDSWEDFRKSKKFNTYQQYLINNYKNDPKYDWNVLVAPLKQKAQEKIDAEDTKIISDLYPEYNFDNATYYYKKVANKTSKFLNGLYCPKIDPITGEPHGISNDLRVKELKKHAIVGCRKCGEDRRKYDITKEIKSVSQKTGYEFDPKNFYYDKLGGGKKLFVKNVVCPKHDDPIIFYQEGRPWEWFKLNPPKGGCPICSADSKSKGEKKVYEELQKLGYNDITIEKTFPGADGCYGYKGQRHCDLLRFDFYIVKDGKEICIEYDGRLHYEASERYGGEEALKATQERDQAKTEYCKKKGIKLIRIPYSDYNNIDKILEKEVGYNDTTKQPIAESKRLQKLAGITELKVVPKGMGSKYIKIKKYPDGEVSAYFDDEAIKNYLKSAIDPDYMDDLLEFLRDKDGWPLSSDYYFDFNFEISDLPKITDEDVEKYATQEASYWFSSRPDEFPYKD